MVLDPAAPPSHVPVPRQPVPVPDPVEPVPVIEEPAGEQARVWALVVRAQAGDSTAVAQLYERYEGPVFRFIYFRVGNRALAEDLAQDVWVRALRSIGRFTWQGRDLGAWLVTIARNLVADYFGSGRYRLELPTGDVLAGDRRDYSVEGDPESAVVDYITHQTILAFLAKLGPEQQEVIRLRFLRGLSVAETAAAMGKNEGAIKAMQYRAIQAIRRHLPHGFLEER